MRNRRTILLNLAALPAIGIPAAAAIAADVSPDAAIIAQAALVKDLDRREREALDFFADLDQRFDRGLPPRPVLEFEGGRELARADLIEIMSAEPSGDWLQYRTPINQHLTELRRLRAIAEAQHDAAIKEWQAECDARRLGPPELQEAHRAADDAYDRLHDAGEALGLMQPTTLAGLIAKASAVRMGDENGCPDDEWAKYLAACIVDDLQAMGGADV